DPTFPRREFLSTAAAGETGPPLQRKRAVIDCHTHVGTASTLTAPWSTIANPEEILRRNREAGIDKACVFPISHDTFEEANREVAAIARRHRDRFIGFAKHDPVREKGRIREMLFRECLELDLRGLKLHVTPTAEVLDAVAELGIPSPSGQRPLGGLARAHCRNRNGQEACQRLPRYRRNGSDPVFGASGEGTRATKNDFRIR